MRPLNNRGVRTKANLTLHNDTCGSKKNPIQLLQVGQMDYHQRDLSLSILFFFEGLSDVNDDSCLEGFAHWQGPLFA